MELSSDVFLVEKIKNKSGKSSVLQVGDIIRIELAIENLAKGRGKGSYVPELTIYITRESNNVVKTTTHTTTFNMLANLLSSIKYRKCREMRFKEVQ